MQAHSLKSGFWWALLATLLAAVVVILGAFTRLTDAGLGCPDWPTCYGHIWAPQTELEIATANSNFPDIPVDLDKTWPEMVHRYLASSLGLFVIGLALLSVKHRKDPTYPRKLPLFLLGFIILQGAFGAWTVTLKLLPQVVTAHLLGGFTTFTLLAVLTLKLSGLSFPKLAHVRNVRLVKNAAMLALMVVVLQVFLGGWTTSNYAALACPDFPKCHTQWLPEMDFVSGFDLAHPIGPNYQGGQLDIPARTAIHFSHRIGAIAVAAITLSLALMLIARQLSGWGLLLIALLSFQVALGISNVVFGLPLSVAVMHNFVGALLLMTITIINFLLHRKDAHYD